MTTWYENAFKPGSQIQGKWYGHKYVVERLLGAGANGLVVLVRQGKSLFALKAGFETVDHQSEINVLKALSKTDTSFKNYLVDVDDFIFENKEIPFSVLRYIDGVTISSYLQKNGQDWIYVIGTSLLKKLSELHKHGYVFGDLKMENMLITGYGEVSLIDFGGVTPKGRAIKQLTEIYDRGYWSAGERFAEDSYDLFSFAILIIHALDHKNRMGELQRLLPQTRSIEHLQPIIKDHRLLQEVSSFLQRALQGQLRSSSQAYELWRAMAVRKKSRIRPKVKTSWLAVCFAASLLLFGATVYLTW
ncbi:Protein kinase domain protein [compost metagenome]